MGVGILTRALALALTGGRDRHLRHEISTEHDVGGVSTNRRSSEAAVDQSAVREVERRLRKQQIVLCLAQNMKRLGNADLRSCKARAALRDGVLRKKPQ